MKTKLTFSALLALLLATVWASAAWAQYTANVQGKVTDKGSPLAGVTVIYTNPNTGRQIKLKTDKKGAYYSIGVPFDTYDVTVVDASGKEIYVHKGLPVAQSGGDVTTTWDIDISQGGSGKLAGGPGGGALGQAAPSDKGKSTQPQVSKEEIEKIKAQNAKAESINALIAQYQAALAAKDWKAAIPPLQGMTTADPGRWEYFQALGNMQLNDGQYEEATQSYEKGIQVAQGYVSGATPKDPKNPNSDPAKAKAGIGQMLTNQGNAYLKLKKNTEAVAAYTKAAEMDPNPGTAYFNLCATQYNSGNTEGALAACDKAIAADPTRADAYFIKGSLMIAGSSADKDGKIIAPPGTSEALNKYLELAPDGGHANDVKQMLAYIGSKIETTYKKRGK
ncbi:MAG TPA: tetratricopeptide repeat protein [Candidatus Angelobacter sp.]|nr:tetratricopeptide repeat protein [Candidatus Angelobacter sp.]